MKKKTRSRKSRGLTALEKAAKRRKAESYVLKLFVTGSTRRSLDAISRIKAVLEENVKGRYVLQVVDVYQNPKEAEIEQIIALPTLIKKLPAPLRKILGDFSDKDRVLAVLGALPKNKP